MTRSAPPPGRSPDALSAAPQATLDPGRPLSSRLQSLDVLRAVAVLLVVGRHLPHFESAGEAASRALAVWQRGGWIGVDLFFVLSGYLVAGLLFREYQRYGEVRVVRFLIRRGLKIYPAFYVFLGATIILRWMGVRQGALPLRGILAECLFFQNYVEGLHQHTWSLAVEEHFYLVCAILILVLGRSKGHGDPFRSIPRIFAGVALAVLTARIVTTALLPFAPYHHVYPTHLRIEGLLFGVVLAYLSHFRPEVLNGWTSKRKIALGVAGGLLMVPAFAFDLESTPALYTFGFTGLYLGSGLLVVTAGRSRMGSIPALRPLAVVGEYSYSLYLWHTTAMAGAYRLLQLGPVRLWWMDLLGVILAVVVTGVGMAKLIEMPVLRIRDRLFPSRLT